MPLLTPQHPRHPTNLALRLHAALHRLAEWGKLDLVDGISADQFRRAVILANGVTRDHAGKCMEHMEDLGLIRWERGHARNTGRVWLMPETARETILAVPA